MVFIKVFLLSHFRLVFLPTTLASLPPGVMLLDRSTALRDSATDIGKTSQKGTSEREQPNRSVVKMTNLAIQVMMGNSAIEIFGTNLLHKLAF